MTEGMPTRSSLFDFARGTRAAGRDGLQRLQGREAISLCLRLVVTLQMIARDDRRPCVRAYPA